MRRSAGRLVHKRCYQSFWVAVVALSPHALLAESTQETTAPADDVTEAAPTTSGSVRTLEFQRWGAWTTLGGGPIWGEGNPREGIVRPTGAFAMTVNASLYSVYVGAGFKGVWFEDRTPLSQEIEEFGSGERSVDTASASSTGGHVEIGVLHRFFIPLRESEGLGLFPMIGYGLEGVGGPTRSVGRTCIGCLSKDAGDYNGGQYARFQLGIYYAGHFPKTHGYVGISPSYQHYFLGESPHLTGYLDLSIAVGFGG